VSIKLKKPKQNSNLQKNNLYLTISILQKEQLTYCNIFSSCLLFSLKTAHLSFFLKALCIEKYQSVKGKSIKVQIVNRVAFNKKVVYVLSTNLGSADTFIIFVARKLIFHTMVNSLLWFNCCQLFLVWYAYFYLSSPFYQSRGRAFPALLVWFCQFLAPVCNFGTVSA